MVLNRVNLVYFSLTTIWLYYIRKENIYKDCIPITNTPLFDINKIVYTWVDLIN